MDRYGAGSIACAMVEASHCVLTYMEDNAWTLSDRHQRNLCACASHCRFAACEYSAPTQVTR
jgi:hypothetical protein